MQEQNEAARGIPHLIAALPHVDSNKGHARCQQTLHLAIDG